MNGLACDLAVARWGHLSGGNEAHFCAGNCTQIFASSLFIMANNSNVQWVNGSKDPGILLNNKKELAVVCCSDEMQGNYVGWRKSISKGYILHDFTDVTLMK